MSKIYLLVLTSLRLLSSCTNANEEPQLDVMKPVNSLENYKFFGEAHNAFLQATVDNYENETRVIGDGDAQPNYDALHNFQLQYAMSIDMEEEYRPILCEGLNQFKAYYDSEKLYQEYFVKKNGVYPIVTELQELKTDGTIDNFEYTHLKQLCEVIAQYKKGTVSLTFLKNSIDEISGQWSEYYGPLNYEAGQTSAYILSIAASSVEWWSEQEVQTRVPAWLAVDVGGAIVAATFEGMTQYALYKRIKDWKALGFKTLSGAVIASTGMAGQIGRWAFSIRFRPSKNHY